MRAGQNGLTNAARLFSVVAVLALTTTGADAASRLCRELEARLAQPSSSAQFQKYDRAVMQQRDEMIRLEDRAARAGCFSGFRGFFGRGNDACPDMLGTLDRMDRNLAGLERKRDRLASRGNPRQEHARILAALDANGCGGAEPLRRLPPPITAEEEYPVPDQDRHLADGRILSLRPSLAGTFRTLCVRTCDGYYFPISFSTTSDLFERDQQACAAQCPGTDVQLYFHRVPGEESEQMVSMAGVPYAELPNAFKYRKANFTRPQGCGCSPAKDFSVMAGEPPKEEATAEEPGTERAGSFVPVPAPRPDSATEQETAAVGGNDETEPTGTAAVDTAEKTPETDAEESATDDSAPKAAGGDRRVRVVGPKFLPDREEAIDLRSPGRTAVQ